LATKVEIIFRSFVPETRRRLIGMPSLEENMADEPASGYERRRLGAKGRAVEVYGTATVALSSVIAFGSWASGGRASARAT
jgi:hypothetical protein